MVNAGRYIIVIGGFPDPVGGVTAFVSRLAENNMVSEVIDIYPSPSKSVPSEFKGRVVFRKGFTGFLSYYLANHRQWAGRLLHFNFSTSRAIVFFLVLPKFASEFSLMLHHGSLQVKSSRKWLYRAALSRLDYVFCMNEGYRQFYRGLGVPEEKMRLVSSYIKIPPLSSIVEPRKDIEQFFDGSRVLVASGYPSSLYNHEWCIDYVSAREGLKLAIFLYGSGDALRNIEERANSERVKIFWNCSQATFNHALSRASVYLRPTSKDSFGVAVADAVELGVPVVASDVCKRYPGAGLFPVDDFSAFCETVDCILNGTDIRTEDSEGFRAFSYSDLDLRDV
ncbi:glycosyltransferase [Pseudomonas aeruginosa]